MHLAVRGLGCPVRILLTAGQAGDAPQVLALVIGLEAALNIADPAYDGVADDQNRPVGAAARHEPDLVGEG